MRFGAGEPQGHSLLRRHFTSSWTKVEEFRWLRER